MSEKKVLNTKLKKFYVILFSLLILLIPTSLLFGIINDREAYKNEAVRNISQAWAKAQLLQAPEMILTIGKDKKHPDEILSLGEYDVSVNIKTEIRKKGIFKIPVYTADIVQKGNFKNPYGSFNNKKAELSFSVTDSKGFTSSPQVRIGNEPLKPIEDNSYTKYLSVNSDKIPFEIRYQLRGLNTISVRPSGTISKISIRGNWKDPSFEGDFLPSVRNVTNKDFDAEWSIPKIATLKTANENSQNDFYAVDSNPSVVTVSLLTPIDNYRMADRALKYAFLFLLLTFVTYYVFEITSSKNKPIHPIQYMLMGGALLIFYLLLTSISEFVPFLLAYIISVISTVALISLYTYFVLTKKENRQFTTLITSVMFLLYTFLYTLLVIQDFSLLLGSCILFAVIAAIMFATRNVEWYDEN